MTDPEILVKFLGFLDIKELKGGSNDLRIRNFKRPPGEGGKLFEASPELFTYLVSSCERLGEQFPGSFQFNKEAILFELPDETEVGRHFVSLLPLDKSAAVEQMKVKNEVGDVEGVSGSEKILLKLLEFLELDERGYGGRDLTLGALKYTFGPRARVLDLSPEQFGYLVSSCEKLAQLFPGAFIFSQEQIEYEQPGWTKVGSHNMALLPKDKAAVVMKLTANS